MALDNGNREIGRALRAVTEDMISNYQALRAKLQASKEINHRLHHDFIGDLQSLLDYGPLSDVKLCCKSEEFKVHKSILAVRSSVFEAMFLNPMKENEQGFVEIGGMDPEILRIMLKYIYTNRIENLNASLACELLAAADMYQLDGLKRVCAEYLRYEICTENALHIVKIADLCDKNLCEYTCKFIGKNYEKFLHMPEWKTLQEECPNIVINIMALKIQKLMHCNVLIHSLECDIDSFFGSKRISEY